jgi:SAM-dependent methyltransferase
MRASPFDEMAADYDRSFTQTACGAALRGLVWQRFPAVFSGCKRILELGCGTGEDAIRLARAGHRVIAIDASAEMIRVARLKALAAGCAQRIEFHVMPMESLHVLPRDQRFDGVFSNFGAVNCVADLPRLAGALAARLDPGAPLLFVPMGRCVPWEWLWFTLRGEPRRALRRLSRAGVVWRGSTIRYPTPGQLAVALRGAFTPVRVRPLGLLLPPSYASGWINRRPRMLAGLLRAERAAQRFAGFASFADHYMFEAQRSAA